MGTDKDSDKALQHYLQGESDLSRRYQRLGQELPSKNVDEAILAASRRQVKARPRVAHSPFASNWLAPLSAAAVLLVAVGLVTFMSMETGEDLVPAPAAKPAPAPEESAELDQVRSRSGVMQDRKEAPNRVDAFMEDQMAVEEKAVAPPPAANAPVLRLQPESRVKAKRAAPRKFAPAAEMAADSASAPATGIAAEPMEREDEAFAPPPHAPALKKLQKEETAGEEMAVGIASLAEPETQKTFTEKIKQIKPGMSRAEVRKRLGKPEEEKAKLWIYYWPKKLVPGVERHRYAIHFQDDQVTIVETTVGKDRLPGS